MKLLTGCGFVLICRSEFEQEDQFIVHNIKVSLELEKRLSDSMELKITEKSRTLHDRISKAKLSSCT